MKERPILFSAPMVRAILAGTKTQTRRIVKPQPRCPKETCDEGIWSDTVDPVTRYFACPYGLPGDRLWVRETWAPNHRAPAGAQDRPPYVLFAANGDGDSGQKWRPSIFMRRHSCRLVLEIQSVRLERLNAINEADAIAEGVESCRSDDYHGFKLTNGEMVLSAVDAYRDLWESINGMGSWEKNPWVWVVTFSRILP